MGVPKAASRKRGVKAVKSKGAPAKAVLFDLDEDQAPLIGEAEDREGFISDFISGTMVRDTAEEREAVQVFSMALVNDYGYPRNHIQTRPQFRVKARPSDRKKEYPVDIAVFSDEKRNADTAHIIVECKQKTRKDGRDQLEDYLRFKVSSEVAF